MSLIILIIVVVVLVAFLGGGRSRGGWGGPRAGDFELIELLVGAIVVIVLVYILLRLL
jgi:hypothetical protein